MAEKVLPYDRGIVRQETFYWCGPASTQVVLNSLGIQVPEAQLAREIGTHQGGTDHIGLIVPILNRYSNAGYFSVQMPNDPPTGDQKERLWRDLVASINGGRGVVANWVAPPSNYPRAVPPSTISPAYAGGAVYHYVAIMGYSDDGPRRVWVADSGFYPYGYWLGFEQLASLVPPKGYAAAPGPANPPVEEQPESTGLRAETLSRAMGGSVPMDRYVQLLPAFVDAMRAAGCTTVERAAMWCAQIGHESVGLRYMEEIADGTAYNGRQDLGNTQPGDGPRYKGSGPIQLTGRHNFRAFSRWCHEKGWVDNPTWFEDRPELVRTDPRWGFLAATWYWTVARPQINDLADARDIVGVTRAINGGTNGLADRQLRYQRCLNLGAALLPSDGGFMSALNDAEQRELLDKTRQLWDFLIKPTPSLVDGAPFSPASLIVTADYHAANANANTREILGILKGDGK